MLQYVMLYCIIFASCAIWLWNMASYIKGGTQTKGIWKQDPEDSYYYSVQTLLSSRLLSKNLKIKIYKTIILPVVLYGCETWPLTLREERKLRVFENRILRRIFGPKRNENGEWRRLHNEELYSLYSSPNIVSFAIWLWNIVSYIKGGMQDKDIWKQDPEANIWAQEGWEWGVKKAVQLWTS